MSHEANPFEFYETPSAFVRFLFRNVDIRGRCFEPCVGSGAIPRAADGPHWSIGSPSGRTWVTNDLDPRWTADYNFDAAKPLLNQSTLGSVDWSVSNPPFEPAVDIIENMLEISRVGVAMLLRASIHEVLKTGVRRTWLSNRPPNGILWLQRFAFQRSPTTGDWATDSMCCCWVVWDHSGEQFIKYADERVLDELDAETKSYRENMDALMSGISRQEIQPGLW